ncbi:MAG: fatty acid metabolism transcriptional regulator FadR [Anaerolineales bacterium]|nr:fatty acid metabolism transcriptional regulator FadR [Anaerolineales bacterium]
MLNQWTAPPRPNSHAETALINAILDDTFPCGSTLPGERSLATQLGVTRPTLREALQRLARDGWLTVHQGKATLVNDYLQDGGLNVLSTLVQHSDQLPPNFVTNLLEVRLNLAPAYTRAAVTHAPQSIQPLLNTYALLEDSPQAMAAFDWKLHRCLTIASQNPIYALILNGFADFYEQLAEIYFLSAEGREKSMVFYAELTTAVSNHNPQAAEAISRAAMRDSLRLWQKGEAARSHAVEK